MPCFECPNSSSLPPVYQDQKALESFLNDLDSITSNTSNNSSGAFQPVQQTSNSPQNKPCCCANHQQQHINQRFQSLQRPNAQTAMNPSPRQMRLPAFQIPTPPRYIPQPQRQMKMPPLTPQVAQFITPQQQLHQTLLSRVQSMPRQQPRNLNAGLCEPLYARQADLQAPIYSSFNMTRQDVQHQTCPLGNCLNKPLNSTPLSQYDASPIRYRTYTPPPPISQPLVMGQYQPQLPLLNPMTRQDFQQQFCPVGDCVNKSINSIPLSQYETSPGRYRTYTPPPPISQPLVIGQYQPNQHPDFLMQSPQRVYQSSQQQQQPFFENNPTIKYRDQSMSQPIMYNQPQALITNQDTQPKEFAYDYNSTKQPQQSPQFFSSVYSQQSPQIYQQHQQITRQLPQTTYQEYGSSQIRFQPSPPLNVAPNFQSPNQSQIYQQAQQNYLKPSSQTGYTFQPPQNQGQNQLYSDYRQKPQQPYSFQPQNQNQQTQPQQQQQQPYSFQPQNQPTQPQQQQQTVQTPSLQPIYSEFKKFLNEYEAKKREEKNGMNRSYKSLLPRWLSLNKSKSARTSDEIPSFVVNVNEVKNR